jgi:small subunit ribosomal protein S16
MVKIRLRRTGAKKQPHYRVVVTDSRSPRDGKFIEIIGHYNPRTEPPTVEIDAERALYWLSVGAQPSEAVRRMLDKMGILAQVPAVRKGELSIEEILAQLELTKAEKKAEAAKEAEQEEAAPEEPAEEEEAEPAEAEAEAEEEAEEEEEAPEEPAEEEEAEPAEAEAAPEEEAEEEEAAPEEPAEAEPDEEEEEEESAADEPTEAEEPEEEAADDVTEN